MLPETAPCLVLQCHEALAFQLTEHLGWARAGKWYSSTMERDLSPLFSFRTTLQIMKGDLMKNI